MPSVGKCLQQIYRHCLHIRPTPSIMFKSSSSLPWCSRAWTSSCRIKAHMTSSCFRASEASLYSFMFWKFMQEYEIYVHVKIPRHCMFQNSKKLMWSDSEITAEEMCNCVCSPDSFDSIYDLVSSPQMSLILRQSGTTRSNTSPHCYRQICKFYQIWEIFHMKKLLRSAISFRLRCHWYYARAAPPEATSFWDSTHR